MERRFTNRFKLGVTTFLVGFLLSCGINLLITWDFTNKIQENLPIICQSINIK